MADLSVPTFCIVTGASKGIGREIEIHLAQKTAPKSSFHLIARNENSLRETAQKIQATRVGEDVEVVCVSADLSTDEGVAKVIREIFPNLGDISRFSHAILVHNAAGIGDMTKCARELDDMNYLQGFCRLNLSGPIVLTSKFFKAFGHGEGSSLRKTIVQVTSSGATTPYKSLHTDCMVKAGRDMFFRVLALEEPEVRVLTYDPGAVDTDMFREIQTSFNEVLKSIQISHIEEQPVLIKPEQSAEALIKALEEDKYENATTVSAYDILGMSAHDKMSK